ncbi:MAG: polymer-forming cytoskeletal protein [Candidatus Acidiferrales bacterium]
MWRKSDEAKPSATGPTVPEPAAAPSRPNQPATAPVSSPEIAAAVHASSLSGLGTPSPGSRSHPSSDALSSSTIGPGLKIRGDITGDSNLIIEGEAQGKIQMGAGRVTVGPNGNVNADIEAAQIIIEGIVQGNLKATDSVRLGPASRVQGSLLARRIAIDDGARLRGKVEMIRASDASATAVGSSADKSSTTGNGKIAATAQTAVAGSQVTGQA